MINKKIFIGGCDRSGTTLLASMLASSPRIATTPESQFKLNLLKLSNRRLPESETKKVLSRLFNDFRFKIWLEKPDFLETFKYKIKPGLSSKEILEEMVSSYCGEEPYCWIDHTPNNIQNVSFLKNVFPESSFIHIVRDGRAVAASVKPLPWGPNTTYHAATWWAYRVSFGCAAELAWPDKVYRVSYESLVNNPEDTLLSLCENLDIQYDSRMLSGSGFKLPSYTKKQHCHVGKSVKSTQVNLWKKRLSDRDIEIFEAKVGGLLSSFGYELLHDKRQLPKISERVKIHANELFYALINFARHRIRLRKLP
ncbi:sulfotransferase family protein [Halomonas tibetensis]|uniref:Sulfotransferase family protein n=1 Tax=Halomonas tibetensis TaxID=2259590 RepID=A0ABV7BBF3_9GAMM